MRTYDWLTSGDVRHPDGWSSIVSDLCEGIDAIIDEAGAELTVRQVKEKMGELRFYYVVAPSELRDRIAGLVLLAQERSRRTCTLCGASGTMRHAGGWIRPLCVSHAQQVQANQP